MSTAIIHARIVVGLAARPLVTAAAVTLVVALRLAAHAAASSTVGLRALAANIDHIHALNAASSASERGPRDGDLELRVARLKQAAIRAAIELYDIDVSRLPSGVHYSPHGGMREREGATYLERDGTLRVQIGDPAFSSAAWLGSTIGHEVEVHVNRQIASAVRYPASDEQGTMLQEVEAYDYELANAARFGLTDDELRVVRQRRASLYRSLQLENRKRADEGLYRKW